MYNNFVYPGIQPSLRNADALRNMKHMCHQYMNYHVVGHLNDGSQVEGIIEDMDDDSVTMLVPEWTEDNGMTESRQFGGYGGFDGYGGYGGYGGGYGGRRRFRRFRRRRFPFLQFVFPFVIPFPYYY